MAERWTFNKSATFTGDFLPKLMPQHRQGTLDGACGFYCVSMILDYFDICDPAGDFDDSRTRLAKFLNSFQQTPLLTKGLTENEVRSVTEYFGAYRLTTEVGRITDFRDMRLFVRKLSARAIPAILRFQLHDGSKPYDHYAVTVGTGDNAIFLMDPARDAPKGVLYNNLVRSKRKDSMWDISGMRVRTLGPCLALYPESWCVDPAEMWGPNPGG